MSNHVLANPLPPKTIRFDENNKLVINTTDVPTTIPTQLESIAPIARILRELTPVKRDDKPAAAHVETPDQIRNRTKVKIITIGDVVTKVKLPEEFKTVVPSARKALGLKLRKKCLAKKLSTRK